MAVEILCRRLKYTSCIPFCRRLSREEFEMSDISRIDEERYEYYLNERKAFPGGDYDFTFNKRFLTKFN